MTFKLAHKAFRNKTFSRPELNRDHFGRTVNYLRLSVTDRCNLRCCYCMPPSGISKCSHDEVLRYEEMMQVSRAAVSLGIEKIRITGGEPLVRKGLLSFLQRLNSLPGLSEITLTTNGLLLAEMASEIKAADVNRLNVSLDSLQPETYAGITRGGNLKKVLAGLDAAERVGLGLKLNMVVMRGINDREICEFAALSVTRPWSVRFIEYMPTIREKAWRNRVLPGSEIIKSLQQKYSLTPLEATRLCGPAKPYRIDGAVGTIGIITPMSDHFCGSCNRIRVTSTGMVKSCLLSEGAFDLKPALAKGYDTVRSALSDVIEGKSYRHNFHDNQRSFQMSSIGG